MGHSKKQTLVGNGHSSRSKSTTAGPRGSSIGMTRISDLTTFSQPWSQSAILCRMSIANGGSWVLHESDESIYAQFAQLRMPYDISKDKGWSDTDPITFGRKKLQLHSPDFTILRFL